MKNVLITGVSSGIGEASAIEFLKRGYRVLGTIRQTKDAQQLISIGGDRFVPLILDLGNSGDIDSLGSRLEEILGDEGLEGVVNNAGIATAGGVLDQPDEELVRQYEINVFGPIRVLRRAFPFLLKSKGRVVQVGSVAGRLTLPFLSAYAGSKHALEAQSDGLRRELGMVGISVVHLQFGAVRTPIWGKVSPETVRAMEKSPWKVPFDGFASSMVTQGTSGLDAEAAGRRLVEIFELRKPKPRYAIVKDRFKSWTLPRLLSDQGLDRVLIKAIGLQPKVQPLV